MSVLKRPVVTAVIGALGVLLTLAVFARALSYDFVRSWDDGRFILNNPDVQHVSWAALARMFGTVQFEAYHPLHLLSYWLDVPWFGPSPCVVHGVSLSLWLLALAQLYGLLRALELPAWPALLCTLFCGVHPVQVEVVTWATGRKDVLALLFVASSLRLQLLSRSAHDKRAWAARVLYLAALLSKTTALPLPLFGVCLDVCVRRKPLRTALSWQWPSLVLGLLVSGLVVAIWDEHAMLRDTLGGPELAPVRIVQTLGQQWLTSLWPSRVSPMYASQGLVSWQLSRTLACGSYLLACGLAWRARAGLVLVGLLGFGLWLAPAVNAIPMYFPLQDRYASLPVMALSIAIAGVLARRPQLQHLAFAAVVLLAFRTYRYAGEWSSEPRLWGHAVSTQPDAEYAYLKLAEVRRDAGELEGAIRAYQGAIHVAPGRKLAHAGLLEAVARRDERFFPVVGRASQARALATEYYKRLDRPDDMQAFAGELWAQGYVRSVELPLQFVMAYGGWQDDMTTNAAVGALRDRRPTLARFFVHSLRRPPDREPLRTVLTQPYFAVAP